MKEFNDVPRANIPHLKTGREEMLDFFGEMNNDVLQIPEFGFAVCM